MLLTILRAVRGSAIFAIPRPILKGLGRCSVADARLAVESHPMPRYTLAGLLAECEPSAPMTAEDREWLDADPDGREVP